MRIVDLLGYSLLCASLPPLILHSQEPSQIIFPTYWTLPESQQGASALSSYDQTLQFLNCLESEQSIENLSFEGLTQVKLWLAYLAQEGSFATQLDPVELACDIAELFREGPFSADHYLGSDPSSWSTSPTLYLFDAETLLCKRSSWSKIGRFIRHHKKEIIIATAVVVAAAVVGTVVAASIAAGAAVSETATGSPVPTGSVKDRSYKTESSRAPEQVTPPLIRAGVTPTEGDSFQISDWEMAFPIMGEGNPFAAMYSMLYPPSQGASPFTSMMNNYPPLKAMFEHQFSLAKEQMFSSPFLSPLPHPNLPLEEQGRILGSFLAHESIQQMDAQIANSPFGQD